MARKPAVTDSEAVAARTILLGLTAWRGAVEQAHQHGVAELWLPNHDRPTPIGDVLQRIHQIRDDARLRRHMSDADRYALRSKLHSWSGDDITHAIGGMESATVLAWALRFLDRFPSWTASMPGFTSIGAAVLSEGVVDRIWKDAALRDRATLEDYRRQAAAWRWRAWAEYYRRHMDDLAKPLRPFAQATIGRIPEIVRRCVHQGWFEPVLDDFPVAGNGYAYVNADEAATLQRIARSRDWALQIALAGADPDAVATDTDALGCLKALPGESAQSAAEPTPVVGQPATLPGVDWSRSQERWNVPLRIPLARGDRTGPSVLTSGMLVSAVSLPTIQQNRYVIWPNWLKDDQIAWCDFADRLLCELSEDGLSFVAVEIASKEVRDALRVPRFIQNEEWPMCCGRSMHFVGQIDDEAICDSPPPGAKLWWHDAASFYVFTCAICLECKAIGQQY